MHDNISMHDNMLKKHQRRQEKLSDEKLQVARKTDGNRA
jgi:hypothetical protein